MRYRNKIDLAKLKKEHFLRFCKFKIDGEIWNIYSPKNLQNN